MRSEVSHPAARFAQFAQSVRWRCWGELLILPLLFFLILVPWAVAAPVGGTPDADFHLNSILCSAQNRGGTCRHSATDARIVEVPTNTEAVNCYIKTPTDSAACVESALKSGNAEMHRTKRWNSEGAYPSFYYRFHSLYAGKNLVLTTMLTRLVNAALAAVLTGAVAGLLGRNRRRNLWLTVLVTQVPLGLSLLSSLNPSSWATLAPVLVFFAICGAMERDSASVKRRAGLVILAVVSFMYGSGARWDSVVFCGLALLAALAWGLDFSALRRRFRGAGTISGVAVSLVVFLLVIIAVSARFLHSTVLGDFFAAVLGRDAAERQSRHDIFMNLLNIPDYFLGVFGLWPLGALEIDLPRVVPFLGFAVCSGVLFLALCQASRRTNLIALVLLLFYVAMPLLLLFEKHATVGVYVQPRYLLPLLTLIVGVWLYPFNRSALMVSVQRWVTGLGTTVSASVALYAVAMRYWRGTQYLLGESTWWWKGVPGPHFWLVMEVLTFGIWAVIILRESRQNQPESAEKDLRTE
ncbi:MULTISPECIES: DUF2142 domain-containing protein [Mobiluncus]|uniref:Tat pathway signal sequence domain protein n=2 Tax=Mobiluncus TaxID=2050 RepID=E6M4I7_9ACTO|nr:MULTISPECIES: DUF2142 domain-containing protein [Mobiluncus]EFU81385.1 hypothetical protein HMPREF0576_1227 [Mobiluncus holmesii ATCC 35242]SQB65459.1 Predicted membrane protein (DUF2142) [Mobiluncus curtisii]STY89958.1 Predicted membrane protein (DUF2142) [Mobiluncus holmesii]